MGICGSSDHVSVLKHSTTSSREFSAEDLSATCRTRNPINCIAVLQDTDHGYHGHVATGSDDGILRIWKVDLEQAAGIPLKELTGHDKRITGIVELWGRRHHSHAAINLASCSDDGTIRIWDLQDGTCIRTLTGHTNRIKCVIATTDGRVVSGGWDHKACIWTRVGESAWRSIALDHSAVITCLAEQHDGSCDPKILTGQGNGEIRCWDCKGGMVCNLNAHDAGVMCIRPLGHRGITSCSLWGLVKVWSNAILHDENACCMAILLGHQGPIWDMVVLSPDKILTAGEDCTLRIWHVPESLYDPHAGPEADEDSPHAPYAQSLRTSALSCLPLQSEFVVNKESCKLTDLLRITPATVRVSADAVLHGHTSGILCAGLLPTKEVATGSDDGTLRIWAPLAE